MKFAVGVMLTTFGMFWTAEGAGAEWPGAELALPVLLAAVAPSRSAWCACRDRQRRADRSARHEPGSSRSRSSGTTSSSATTGTWPAGVVLALTAALVAAGVKAWWLMPIAVVATLFGSLRRATRRR